MGAFYFCASWLGYEQPQLASAVADYGTKFLVCAGLLNILAMIDAYEIASGRSRNDPEPIPSTGGAAVCPVYLDRAGRDRTQ